MQLRPFALALVLSVSFVEIAHANDKGLELMVRPGYGSVPADSPVRFVTTSSTPAGAFIVNTNLTNGTDQPYGGGFVGSAYIGYRFASFLSIGVRGGYRASSAEKATDGSTNLSREAWEAGLYLRGYPLAPVPAVSKYIEPWISIGAVYNRDVQTFDKPIAATSNGAKVTVDGNWKLDHHAVAIPMAIGIDYRILPMLAVGPSFEYAIAVPVAGCVAVSAPGAAGFKFCSGDPPGDQFIKANGYNVWSLGLQVRATF